MVARRGESLRPPVFGNATGLLSIAATALLLLLPLGEGPVISLLVPHLVLVPVYFFTLRPVEGVGPAGAFAGGLSVDILNSGPLGVTAASFLAVHWLLHRERATFLELPAVFRLCGFALAAGFVLALSFISLAILGPGRWPSPIEAAMVFAGLLAIAALVELAMAAVGLVLSRARLKRRRRAKAGGRAKSRRSKSKLCSSGGLTRRSVAFRRGFAERRP